MPRQIWCNSFYRREFIVVNKKSGYVPKNRGKVIKKRNPIIFVNAEGVNKTETNYLKKFSNRALKIVLSSDHSTDPETMVKKLAEDMKKYDFNAEYGDKSYCLIDSDVNVYKDVQISKADSFAKRKSIELIVSSPCFEIWYICHFHCCSMKQYNSSSEVQQDLLECMPSYKKNSDNLYEILYEKTNIATKNAKKMEQDLLKNGFRLHTVKFMPSTEVYRIIEYINAIKKD